jgi:hypothetical protein
MVGRQPKRFWALYDLQVAQRSAERYTESQIPQLDRGHRRHNSGQPHGDADGRGLRGIRVSRLFGARLPITHLGHPQHVEKKRPKQTTGWIQLADVLSSVRVDRSALAEPRSAGIPRDL